MSANLQARRGECYVARAVQRLGGQCLAPILKGHGAGGYPATWGIGRDGGDYSGTLEIAQVGRPLKVRVIEAETCRAVTTSIATPLSAFCAKTPVSSAPTATRGLAGDSENAAIGRLVRSYSGYRQGFG